MRNIQDEKDGLLAEEQGWIAMLQTDDEQALELIFNRYYKYLVVTAYNYLKEDESAKDLVQDVFFKFWEKRNDLNINSSLKAFLRRSVVNKCIDEIRRKKMTWEEEVTEQNAPVEFQNIQSSMETEELQQVIHRSIDSLPEKCKLVFSLSRFENMSHREIADALGISMKTIENQITKALKVIRVAVDKHKGHLTIWILAIIKILS